MLHHADEILLALRRRVAAIEAQGAGRPAGRGLALGIGAQAQAPVVVEREQVVHHGEARAAAGAVQPSGNHPGSPSSRVDCRRCRRLRSRGSRRWRWGCNCNLRCIQDLR